MKTWFPRFFKSVIHLIAYTDFRNSTRTRQKFQSTGLVRSNKSEDAKKKKKKTNLIGICQKLVENMMKGF